MHEGSKYGVIRESVSLGHFVEQLAGIFDGAAFRVGVNETVEDEGLG